MNKPYVKQFNENGECINPIKGIYATQFPDLIRNKRRKKTQRFHGESKNYHLTVLRTGKYLRHRQIICVNGKNKTIEHYIPLFKEPK